MSGQRGDTDKDTQRTIFFRQRKSLLIVSLLLFFVYYAHFSINKVSVQGLNVEVAIPESIHFMLWTSWLYFFIRFMQYYLITAEGSLGDIYRRESEQQTKSLPGLRAMWKTVAYHTHLTDYILPMAFAVFAAVFALAVM